MTKNVSIAICSLAATLAAQNIDDPAEIRSPMASLPVAWTQAPATLPANASDPLWFVPPGAATVAQPPSTFVDATSPDFTFADWLQRLDGYDLTDFGFGATSSGNDGNPSTNGGEVDLGSRWLAINLSISNASGVVWPAFPVDASGKQGAVTATYFMSQSTVIWPNTLGVLQLNRTGAEMSVPTGGDVDTLDSGIALMHANPGLHIPTFVPNRTHWFFSVSHDWVYPNHGTVRRANLPPNFALSKSGQSQLPPDPAVVYHMIWDVDHWKQPQVFLDRSDLGLIDLVPNAPNAPTPPGYHAEAVDALMIGFDGITNTHGIYFSTRMNPWAPGRNQLQTLEANGPVPLLDNGVPVTTRVGTGTDKDIDSACGWDPEIAPHDTVASHFVGIPVGFNWGPGNPFAPPALHTPMGLSVSRRTAVTASGTRSFLVFECTGRGGSGNTGDCVVQLMVSGNQVDWMPIMTTPWIWNPATPTAPQLTFEVQAPFGINTLYFEAHLGYQGLPIAASNYVKIR